ncbi:hypothetical protein EYF80_010090 [Liparis tanakae]|uniref:Uncharacterized protein n=1 Tax=Liparis tanakae TaxID=230148 RepID=A0A4Z2IPC6_9TELE|nr:hypothetical protein EYF80_010090 [Liparis tanakae]
MDRKKEEEPNSEKLHVSVTFPEGRKQFLPSDAREKPAVQEQRPEKAKPTCAGFEEGVVLVARLTVAAVAAREVVTDLVQSAAESCVKPLMHLCVGLHRKDPAVFSQAKPVPHLWVRRAHSSASERKSGLFHFVLISPSGDGFETERLGACSHSGLRPPGSSGVRPLGIRPPVLGFKRSLDSSGDKSALHLLPLWI